MNTSIHIKKKNKWILLQEYRAYSVRDICSARPEGRFRSASLTTGYT